MPISGDVIRDATIGGVVAVYVLEKVLGRKKKKAPHQDGDTLVCPHGVDKDEAMTKSHHDEVCDLKLLPMQNDLSEIKADVKSLLKHVKINGGNRDGTP